MRQPDQRGAGLRARTPRPCLTGARDRMAMYFPSRPMALKDFLCRPVQLARVIHAPTALPAQRDGLRPDFARRRLR